MWTAGVMDCFPRLLKRTPPGMGSRLRGPLHNLLFGRKPGIATAREQARQLAAAAFSPSPQPSPVKGEGARGPVERSHPQTSPAIRVTLTSVLSRQGPVKERGLREGLSARERRFGLPAPVGMSRNCSDLMAIRGAQPSTCVILRSAATKNLGNSDRPLGPCMNDRVL